VSQSIQNSPALDAEVRGSETGTTGSFDLAKSLGVVRHLTETYSVGGFRYTNLADAIAQARRMLKQGEAVQ
jgi:hypothetical protein